MPRFFQALAFTTLLLFCGNSAIAANPASTPEFGPEISSTVSSSSLQGQWWRHWKKQNWKHWRGHRKGHGGGGSAAPAPEPMTWVMLLLAGVSVLGASWLLHRRRALPSD